MSVFARPGILTICALRSQRFERELPKAQGVLPLMMKARDMMNLDTRHARLTRYSKD